MKHIGPNGCVAAAILGAWVSLSACSLSPGGAKENAEMVARMKSEMATVQPTIAVVGSEAQVPRLDPPCSNSINSGEYEEEFAVRQDVFPGASEALRSSFQTRGWSVDKDIVDEGIQGYSSGRFTQWGFTRKFNGVRMRVIYSVDPTGLAHPEVRKTYLLFSFNPRSC